MRRQPITQRQQAAHRRLKLRQMRHADPALIGYAHARRDRRLMHVKRRGTLHDHLHYDHLLALDTERRREGSRRSTSLKIVLNSNSPEFRAGPPRQTSHGLNTRHSGAASPSGQRIIAHFHPTGTDNSAERN